MLRQQKENKVPHLDYWIRGARLLQQTFEDQEAVFETRMEEGTCVIFDNWRILHGRRQFEGGERWLRGAYIDDDAFRHRVLKMNDYHSLQPTAEQVQSADTAVIQNSI